VTVTLLLAAVVALAQPADTLRLTDVRAAAGRHDPRSRQREILTDAAQRRLENLRAERLPALALSGQATWQDDVASLPLSLPGVEVPRPPHEQFRVQLEAEQLLFDGGRLARRADVERARLAEAIAGVEATLYTVREAATDAFFGVMLARSRLESLDLGIRDLEARRALVVARADAGAALAADVRQVEAETIRLRQMRDEAAAARDAALMVLSSFIGVTDLSPEVVLVVPPELAGTPRGAPARPELERLERARDRSTAEARLARAARLPDVRLFAQSGVGRPDPFIPFDDGTDTFAILGVRFRWNVFDWGRARREEAIARGQAELADSEREGLALAFERAIAQDLVDIDRLRAALVDDEAAIRARGEVLRVARRQFEEGVLLVADYTDRLTDLLDARLVRDRHQVELARAHARVLSTLGRFPGEGPDEP
jgi:outer membrane protein TolC